MLNFTPEQRKEFAKKSVATRKANIEKRNALDKKAEQNAINLKYNIEELEKKLFHLQAIDAIQTVSCTLTKKVLLREEEIVKESLPYEQATGVYFLINNGRIVYVGQAVCVHSRLRAHSDKNFDRYAYIACPVEMLNKLESLYIHCLRPELNGNAVDGQKFAPIPLNKLLQEKDDLLSS